MNELRDKITKLLLEELDLEVPSSDFDLFEMGFLDSLKLVELIVLLENDFGVAITIDDLEIENFSSVDRIAEFLNQQNELTV